MTGDFENDQYDARMFDNNANNKFLTPNAGSGTKKSGFFKQMESIIEDEQD